MASGSRDAERVKLKLEIKVEVFLFFKFGSLFSCCAYSTEILDKNWTFELS